ncbi:methyltransferase domain-containing protein [Roseiflexus castenholzii]|jgi:SAM-dependent methyltransferase|uniref:Methyltransferase type 11 n=1 Tax=Roseiflexus castenholzii (strain DSM 13941 / HLO8) TaxID=383372 RepID=A7NIQ6_ROSCS|nr:methyltransferase domain-containing protein [Roseiflexus castenholzii]ABU57359.1 Methyltransferase type 11 [Roseiflexus castenholzii DSM 13941]
MRQKCNPPATGLVLEIGSGDNPHPRANILLDRYPGADNRERGGDLVVDRPFVVADAHYLPFKDGAFAYTICSHILEHMDDPLQFAAELRRVSAAGYIQSPSEIAERLFHWSFHRWYVNLEGETLVLHPREPAEPFGELFDYLYAYNPAYYFFQRSMPDLFWVEREWHGDNLNIEVRDSSPLRLRDPAFLRDLVRPQMSLFQLIGLFIASLVARALDANVRRQIRRLLRRSYV